MSESVSVEPSDGELTEALSGPAVADAYDPGPGTQIGRYLVVRRAGRGAMGTVLRAYDPKLQREVALKLVGERADESTLSRVVREARAMAKLNHPNVVAVFDVDELGSEPERPRTVFIVMEFVQGTTLGAWRKERSRNHQEIIDAFVQAGRGLAAAHAADLVHRDFKPANVLVGDDGRVRVTDFGLVRGDSTMISARGGSSDSIEFAADDLTRVGTVMGTPTYMAPEQHEGAIVDARADVYSFCVALYEALHGRKPFVADELVELIRLKVAGVPSKPGADGVPAWIDRVIARGLCVKPTDRWSSMSELLVAMQRDPRRRRRVAALGLGVVLIGSGAYAKTHYDRAAVAEACRAESEAILSGWGESQRQAVADRFEADGRAFAPVAGARVQVRLDDYAQAWGEARQAVCLAKARDPRLNTTPEVACLDERRLALSALVTTLLSVERGAVPTALDAVLRLPRLAECSDPAALERTMTESDLLRRTAVRGRVREAWALSAIGRNEDAMAVVAAEIAQLGDTAEDSDDALLWAEAVAQRAAIHGAQGDLRAAAADLREAYWVAGQERADRLAARAAISLISIEGSRLGQKERGFDWIRDAQMALRRSGADVELLEAELARVHAAFLANNFEDEQAIEVERRALAIYETTLGPDHPYVAASLTALGAQLTDTGDFDQAKASLLRALSVRKAAYGDEHPLVGSTLANLAQTSLAANEIDQAAVYADKAVSIRVSAFGEAHVEAGKARALRGAIASRQGDHARALLDFEAVNRAYFEAYGPDSTALLGSHNNLAIAYKNLGRVDEAVEHFETAVRIGERIGGPESTGVVGPLANLARLYRTRDEFERSLATIRRVKAIVVNKYGADHSDYANACTVEGSGLMELGKLDEALDSFRESIRSFRAVEGPAGEGAAYGLLGTGDVHWRREEFELARDAYAEARSLLAKRRAYTPQQAYADFGFVRASVALSGETTVAPATLALATRAHEFLASGSPVEQSDAQQVRTWLERHGPKKQ